ncbi:hypothetical protein BKK79_00815 [Cupriavidus sp. USMAA2-4]|uniref:hypothetical protein n=1 Tax=Cupriavidus sp. USMAA2-4 TaxID=876364 RepID=UPI0008A6C5AA|nr:hypothetical protein [Cupriavidus sp. USMAA2-4]AOY90529.1 hypothetical protein BKK79_00815 [Cupriavidus sp. USMAA2-4]
MTTADNRRRRLDTLIREKFGTQAEFIRQTGENQGAISAILKGARPFGEKKARDIERKAGVEWGWLDRAEDEPQGEAPEATGGVIYDPQASTGSLLAQAAAAIAAAPTLRDMQIAEAIAILQKLPDGALSKGLGYLQDLLVKSEAPAAADPDDVPVMSRKKKVLEFTGLHPEPTAEKRHKR